MNTRLNRNITHIRNLLHLLAIRLMPAERSRIRITDEQYSGDPTEEIAGYKSSQTPAASGSQDTGLEDFERDYHWFLA